jgi:putative DNA primase/helicase
LNQLIPSFTGRIVKTYGTRVLVAADRWHVWDGARWEADEAGVYRYACHLSAIVKDEAKSWESTNNDVAQALKKWSARCEMKGTIEAAVGLARKMLTVDVETLDADPWLLNVRNGVVDLRTGRLGKHDPGLMMTKIAGADYYGLDAPSSGVWERAVLEIVGGDQGVANFLRRWFGYCCTGLTQEQVFVVHWGDGANGKSTVLETIARVLGDYAATAASSLLVGDHSERAGAASPEVAALRGRRMVTAHETGEGMRLREAFVKQATGSDRISARHLYGEPFSFLPTHKIQLLTNSKPTVRGQDHGIWRRVRLVPYTQRFGTAEDVAAKRATRVRDLGIAEALGTEQVLSEVLTWLVRGAVEWHTSGLHEPSIVVEASEAYRLEQDRVLQFLRECCELDTAGDKDWSEPLTQGMVGLYPAYVSWVKDSGGHALSRQKFVAELQRAHPRAETFDSWGKGEGGGRRKVVRVRGVRLLAE